MMLQPKSQLDTESAVLLPERRTERTADTCSN